MKTLVIDTETSSLPNKNLPVDHPEQARILELAAIVLDDKLQECGVFHCFIAHDDDIIIHPGAQAVHGITLDYCRANGVSSVFAISALWSMCCDADRIVAHNLGFDSQLCNTEFVLNNNSAINWKAKGFCTMLSLTNVCKLPAKSGRAGYKWPKVEEAMAHCFPSEKLTGLHSALADCRYAVKLYRHCVGLQQATSALSQPALI